MDKNVCINLGCGAQIIQSTDLEQWYNIDWADDVCKEHPDAIIKHDLTLGLPSFFIYSTSQVSFINMCQFLEHLNLPMAISLLRQCREVLIPESGRIRISVPDAGLLYDRFIDDRMDEFNNNQPPIYQEMNHPMIKLALLLFGSLDKEGNSGHKMMYTHGSLKYLLEYCGFMDVVYEAFNPQYDAYIASNHQLALEARRK